MSDDDEVMLEDCENREASLSDWERGFLDSIRKRMEDGESLTDAQSEKLEQIWTRIT